MTGPSAAACNTLDQPDTIGCKRFNNILLGDGNATLQLPPLSVAGISFNTPEGA